MEKKSFKNVEDEEKDFQNMLNQAAQIKSYQMSLERKKFDKLPYAKKVCFVPFETELDSGFYIEPEIVRGREFWQPVNETSSGLMNYDLWDMLLYGKKTPLKIVNN